MKDVPSIVAARNFNVAYSALPVVRAVTLALREGEILAVLGRNGMGKTTLLRGIVGLAPVRGGELRIAGQDVIAAPPEAIARSGTAYVPAGRGIFGSLSVRENLIMCARGADADEISRWSTAVTAARRLAHEVFGRVQRRPTFAGARRGSAPPTGIAAAVRSPPRSGATAGDALWTLERVLALFPRLAERLNHGGQLLSGGEQQMLAIGRALMTNPRLLLIDEATEGLAPLVARDIWRTLGEVCRSGVAVMIVDRDVRQLAKLASRAVVMFKGEIVFDGAPDALLGNDELIKRYIGL